MSWTARALLLSGRPDPTWELPAGADQELLAVWSQLPPAEDAAHPAAPSLGYRGVEVRSDDDRVWVAASGRVELSSAGGTAVRRDEARAFERLVLGTAPGGLLPPGIV